MVKLVGIRDGLTDRVESMVLKRVISVGGFPIVCKNIVGGTDAVLPDGTKIPIKYFNIGN